jgi:AraC-like DNA-binding protein
MAQLARFTTNDIIPAERLRQWDASVWNPIIPCYTRAVPAIFSGEAHVARMGPLHILHIAASAHELERPPEARPSDKAGLIELIELIVQRAGRATIKQAGRTLLLEPGMWTICDAQRAFTMSSTEPGEQLIMLLPRDRLAIGASLSGYAACCFGANPGAGRLLPHYLSGLLDEIAAVDDNTCAELADMATQLVRLALFEARHAAPLVSMRETLRLRIKDYVRRNVRDPALSIDRVAAAFGCTKRHLHKVFSGDDMTLSQFVWSERLERCRDALTNPAMARRSITEIAFMWGFNNSAHFSKAFKERFGAPPGLFRARAIQPPLLSAAA